MTGQEIKELKAVNETELSQAADALLKAEPNREESGLILEGVLLTVDKKINRENSPKEKLYALDSAVELMEGLIWNLKLTPKEKYRALTENADLDKEENAELLALHKHLNIFFLNVTQEQHKQVFLKMYLINH